VSPRPPIFISAVTKELRSARQLVANTLAFLGYEPVWQDIFGTENGDLRGLMRKQIDQCKGVVQLVGRFYGSEPPTPDEKFGRVSYTQYEALYARERGTKVWYLFIDETFPVDPSGPEPEELRELQAAYRRRIQADTHVFHPLTSSEALESSVLKLRDDLTGLRRGVKRWAVAVVALLLFLSAASLWLVQAQRRQGAQVTAIVDRNQRMQQALVRLAEVEAQSKQPGSKLSPAEQRAAAYATLEKELGLTAGSLARELPAFALELYNRPDTTPLMRARAAYALNKFDEAEKLSLEGAGQDRQAYETARRVQEDRRKQAIEGYVLAGQSAQKLIQYDKAMEHFREAEKLTDRERNPEDWSAVQTSIGELLFHQGQYSNAATVLRTVVEFRTRALGSEHPDTLKSRNIFSLALMREGKYAEAEAQYREVIKLQGRILGPEHSDTLSSRHGLTAVLFAQGKYADAEGQNRENIKITERLLGPEHPDTLVNRSDLAITLQNEGKYSEAEVQYREVIKLQEKVRGPEHPETLNTRCNLAVLLDQQGKYSEAEAQFREVIKIFERVLGPEHPNTLMTRQNLGYALEGQEKYSEAEAQYREVLRVQTKVLGPDHPDALNTRNSVASALAEQGGYAEVETLCRELIRVEERILGPEHPLTVVTRLNLAMVVGGQGKYAEAEVQFREVINMFEKAFGPEHPATMESRYDFARQLGRQGKTLEAEEFARQAAQGTRKTLGPEHPSTKKYEKLLSELQAKP